MNKEKIKQFVDEYKAEIIITGLAAVTGLAIGCTISNHRSKRITSKMNQLAVPEFIDNIPKGAVNGKLIDEDIFTNIAPQIEDLVLKEGLDEGFIDVCYDVEYPKFGDIKKGIYTVTKNVKVVITDIGEKEK